MEDHHDDAFKKDTTPRAAAAVCLAITKLGLHPGKGTPPPNCDAALPHHPTARQTPATTPPARPWQLARTRATSSAHKQHGSHLQGRRPDIHALNLASRQSGHRKTYGSDTGRGQQIQTHLAQIDDTVGR